MNFNIIRTNTLEHERIHRRHPQLTSVSHLHRDLSCTQCYPLLDNLPPEFLIFWNWIVDNYRARDCTANTLVAFQELLVELNPQQVPRLAQILLISIRYQEYPEDFNQLYRDYSIAAARTHQFTVAPEEVILSSTEQTSEENSSNNNPSDLESNSDNNSVVSHSTIRSDSDSESTLGLDQLFDLQQYQQLQQLVPMGQDIQNLTDVLNQVLNALHPVPAVVPELNNVKYPEYYGGDQDPISWIEEMEQAFITNRVAADRKVPIAANIEDIRFLRDDRH